MHNYFMSEFFYCKTLNCFKAVCLFIHDDKTQKVNKQNNDSPFWTKIFFHTDMCVCVCIY